MYSGEEQTRENKKKERIKTKRQKEKKCIKTKRDQKTEKLLHKDNKRRNTSIIMKGIQMGNKTEKQRGRQIEIIKIRWMKVDKQTYYISFSNSYSTKSSRGGLVSRVFAS